MSFIGRFRKWISFNRLGVIREQYLAVKAGIKPRNAKEREELAFYTKEFEKYYRKTSRLTNWRVILYCILYASILVSIIQFIPLLSFLAQFISSAGTLGGGIAVVLIFIITVRINVHLQRLQACLMPLVVMHQMNAKRDTQSTLQRLRKVI